MTSPSAYPPAPRTNTLALVGFIAAFVLPVVGIVLGALASRQLSTVGNQEGGRGLARWALILGVLGTLVQLAFFAVWLTVFLSVATGHLQTAP